MVCTCIRYDLSSLSFLTCVSSGKYFTSQKTHWSTYKSWSVSIIPDILEDMGVLQDIESGTTEVKRRDSHGSPTSLHCNLSWKRGNLTCLTVYLLHLPPDYLLLHSYIVLWVASNSTGFREGKTALPSSTAWCAVFHSSFMIKRSFQTSYLFVKSYFCASSYLFELWMTLFKKFEFVCSCLQVTNSHSRFDAFSPNYTV